MSKEAMTLALEALEMYLLETNSQFQRSAVTALREALAEQPAQQEPVATNKVYVTREQLAELYPPASKPWVGLTQQDINIAFDDTQEGGGFDDFARAIEAKLREKNAQPSKPLTDEQIIEMYNEPRSDAEMLEFARAIEAAHGIKENT